MEPLLHVQNLSLRLGCRSILSSITFHINHHQIVALVGESGSGKTLLSRCLMGVLPSPALSISSGHILFRLLNGRSYTAEQVVHIRGAELSYVPQSPLNAFNPLLTIGRQLTEGCRSGSSIDRAHRLLVRLGFYNPGVIMQSYPHQLSGGMRQRALIAMALMNRPQLLIADEPTSALDVTTQAEVMDLFLKLNKEEGLGLLLITHDLPLVASFADHVMIMKGGSVVEQGSVEHMFHAPKHPYTQHLLHAHLS